jgi:hypothetical protein
MDRDFREVLYRAGLAMDAVGIHWTILSAFRDDYRQSLASGYKARIGDSLHGGSATTGEPRNLRATSRDVPLRQCPSK